MTSIDAQILERLEEFSKLTGKTVKRVGMTGFFIKTFVIEFEDGTVMRIGGADLFIRFEGSFIDAYEDHLMQLIQRYKQKLQEVEDDE